ncbi:hypothetical protein MYOV003v1_p0098 [Vibrio phage 207E48.1]|nr:hypothetical protein MYOV003v1_p0098 [Vibrio phage 207E48.1]
MSLGIRITLTAADKDAMNRLMNYLAGNLEKVGGAALAQFEPQPEAGDIYRGDWTVYPNDIAAAMLMLDEQVLQTPMKETHPKLWNDCIIQDTLYTIAPPRVKGDIPFGMVLDIMSYTQERATNHQRDMVLMMGEINKLKQQQKLTIDTIGIINEAVSGLHAKWNWLTDMVGIKNWPTVLRKMANEITLLGGAEIDLEPVKEKPTKH